MRQHCPSQVANGIEGGMQECWKLVFDCNVPACVCQGSGIDLLTRSNGALYLRANSSVEKKKIKSHSRANSVWEKRPKDQNFQKLAICLWKRNLNKTKLECTLGTVKLSHIL